jgi:uncharacterized membrane protein required for colicin V production
MLKDLLLKINWVDLLILFTLLRVFYAGLTQGFYKEIFKLAGVIVAIYLSLHYFTSLSDLLKTQFGVKTIPVEFLDFACFLLLAIIGCYIVTLVRSVFDRFVKVETVPVLSKWGGLILGIGRGFLLVSLIVFCFTISGFTYFRKSVATSFTGREIFRIAPATYQWIWKNISSRFMPLEKGNEIIPEIEALLNK